ncbi:MAG: helix-turn-helix transcriptional regulator [Clostridia bacterium]|nr:helix-turn-helix transcriptional regulator [Clostridia bacterium]
MPDIGRHIADSRKKNMLTQEQLASALHVTRQTVSSWENGRTLPDVETLAQVATALNVSVEELIYGKRSNPAAWHLSRCRKTAIAAGCCAIATVLLDGAREDFYQLFHRTYRLPVGRYEAIAAQALFKPLIWVFCTVELLALLAMSRRLSIKRPWLRKTALLGGAALMLFYVLQCLAAAGILPTPWLAESWRTVNHNAWLFLIPTAALFLGAERNAAPAGKDGEPQPGD